jgi:hypothetical protein
MILYFCFLIAILVVVTLLYEFCKVCPIIYAVTVNTLPSHRLVSSHCKTNVT